MAFIPPAHAGDVILLIAVSTVLAYVAKGATCIISGEVLMTKKTQIDEPPYLTNLQARHGRLEQQIAEEYLRPLPDADLVHRLKVEKLHLKEQIELVKAH
jgi:hypothetical protein